MKDNSDIPLLSDQLKSKVLVFAIIDEATHEYEQITKGYVQLSTDEDEKNNTLHYLEVKDEETNQVLMRSNLNFQNNFGKQKGSIISWTDQQQPQFQDIALSFQKQKQCEMFWRLICQKIGKNYLEIKGEEKIQQPNNNNLSYILQETKNNVELVDYNVTHAGSLILGLRKVYQQMKENNDEMGIGIVARIVNNIMSPSYSSGTIQTFLMKDNFKFLLEVQEFKKGIGFLEAYEISVGNHLSNRFGLPEEIFQKVQLSYRAVFYRENVLNLIEDSLLESMLLMIVRQAQVEIMSYLNKSKFLDTLVHINSYPSTHRSNLSSLKQQKQSLNSKDTEQYDSIQNNDSSSQEAGKKNLQESKCSRQDYNFTSQLAQQKMNFIHEALIMYQQISSQQIKATFKQNIFSDTILHFLQTNILNNSLKALQLLHSIIEIDKLRFFQYLVQQFKADSNNNLLKILIKKYLNQSKFLKPILYIIESLAPLFNQHKELFDFFLGTFFYSIVFLTKQARKSLALIHTLLWNSINTSPIFQQIVKSRACNKIAAEYRNGTGLKSKQEELQMVKMLKYILIELTQKGENRDNKMQETLIESGFLECCIMIYLKYSMRYNLISSSMLQNFKILQKISYSEIHKYLIQQYSTNKNLLKILEPIQKKHISFQNKIKKDQVQLSQSHQVIHQFILQNQHLDQYLMKDDNQTNNVSITSALKETQLQKQQLNSQKSSNQPQKLRLKDQNLLVFKRIMSEISQLQDECLLNESSKRKAIKKSQQNNEMISMEICLELPQIDQIQDSQN